MKGYKKERNMFLLHKKIILILLSLAALFTPLQSSFAVDLSLGQSAELKDPTVWEKWPSGLANPSPGALVQTSADGLSFFIPESGKAMIWRQPLRPAWMDFHHHLAITYHASGISKTSAFPLVRLRTGYESWFTALSSSGVQDDGLDHTVAIDLKPLSSASQIVGIQIQLISNPLSGATFVLSQCDFTDNPPGYEYPPPPAPAPVNVGFEMNVSNAAPWQAKPEWLSNPSLDYSLVSTGASLLLTVNDLGKGMKWLNTSIGSQNTTTYPYILMHYRCRNLQDSASNYAVWLSGAAESRPFYQDDLQDDGLWRWGFASIGVSSVNQMALQVQNNSSNPAFLEIESLRFVDNDPRTDLSYFIQIEEGWDDLTSGTAGFTFANLESLFNAREDQLLPRMGLNVSWFKTAHVNADRIIPFQIKTNNPNLVCTALPTISSIAVPINVSASEIYLVLGAFLPGREISGSDLIVNNVDEMERFYVEVKYAGGTSETFFPLDVFSKLHRMQNNSFSAFAVPANPAKIIEKIILYDMTDGGLFALAGLTLNTAGTRFYQDSFAIPDPEQAQRAPQPASKSTSVQFSSNLLTLENTYNRLVFDLSSGCAFKEWTSHYTGHNILPLEGSQVFSAKVNGTWHTSQNFQIQNVETQTAGSQVMAAIRMSLPGNNFDVLLSIGMDEAPETRFDLVFKNNGTTTPSFELLYPDLPRLTLGADPENILYAYPQLTFLCGNDPVTIEESYSGDFPMQFMDLYDPSNGWGIYLLVKDLELIDKSFRLEKHSDSAGLMVRYPTLASTGLPPGETMELAPLCLGLHSGDWHEAMKAYQNWVQSWYAPRSPRQSWFNEIYACRRDYPISGSGYLLDRITNSYTFDREIENADSYLGGADLIDISSWAWSASSGRVGDYRIYQLGGLDNFRSGISYSRSHGVPVGLYIEGYNIDDRSSVFAAHGEEWKLLNSLGQEIRNDVHEVVMCPHVSSWQEHMHQLYKDVVSETGADSMYLDVFGMAFAGRACFRPDHGHRVGEKPLRGEFHMTRRIREGLNEAKPGIPLYTEYTPVDFTSQVQDGSFSYTIWYGDNEKRPTETNLFRFCFPDFKQIELVNGLFLAMNWTEEGLKKAFFNGEGIWVKGDIASWYDAQTVAFYIKSHELFQDHRDALTSGTVEPFIPTLTGNVYAHLFEKGDKQILMFYNANYRNVSSDLAQIGSVSNVHVVDLWGETLLDTVSSSSDYTIHGPLLPRDIGCVGIFKKLFHASCADGQLAIIRGTNSEDTQINLVGVDGHQRRSIVLPDPSGTYSLDLKTLFNPLPQKLLVKIMKNGIVLDEVILTNVNNLPVSRIVSWNLY